MKTWLPLHPIFAALLALAAAAALGGTSARAQIPLLAIEFNQDDQAGFDLWPSAFSGTASTANFPTDPAVTSGTTMVTVTTSTGFGVPVNRGSVNGNPPGYSYQQLYEDLLHATSATGALTLAFSGLKPSQSYRFTLYAWDPGATDTSDKVWAVIEGTSVPAQASVNFRNPLVNNASFAMVFEVTTTAAGTFRFTNTAGLSQSAINGFTLAANSGDVPPTIISQPRGTWSGGPTVVLEVVAAGTAPLGYQWLLDGEPIGGANAPTLTLDSAVWQQGGSYTVRVSNASGFVVSDPAAVTYVLPPTREQMTYEPLGPSSRRSGVAVSEIHYHPARRTDAREIEFVELFNSQPWVQDISGWRLTGDITFTFPEGASIPALGFAVAARVPGDVQAEYGLAGVFGPWTNNLPNRGGRIRLRKPSGAIVQEVSYDDNEPWPIAADGAGPSLILARPSYGEADPRAWEPSHGIGGSPGKADPVPSDPLDHIFVSTVLSNSDLPLEDFVELRNAAPFAVHVSGCLLSDARDTLGRYTIPSPTSIPAFGTLRLTETQLGFGLDSTGDAVYLTNAGGTRVLDAVRLPAAATDVPFSRARGDAPLRADIRPRVVINEIQFHPPTHDEADEWIEIHCPGAAEIDLSGWAFTEGIAFVFPPGTRIAAGGFLVVARERARVLTNHPALDPAMVLGDFTGALADGGERVELSRPEAGVLVAEDAVRYADSDRWHHFADGRGATLERRDPRGDSLAASNWADSDESAKASWTTVEFTGTLAFGNTASAAQANQVQMFLLGPGESLVDSVEVIPAGGSNVVPNGGFESGAAGWVFEGNQRRSVVETGGAFEGGNALRLVATRRGDPGPNRARAPLTQTLAAGSRATLRARVRWLAGHPEFLLRLKGNWLEAAGRLDVPKNLGTPGAPNSRAIANAGPSIALVTHRPVLPAAGESITVFAEATDPDGVGSVTLRYRVDPSSSLVAVPMTDDGAGADGVPGDGIFSAAIPGQANGTLVAFRIEATDAKAPPATSSFPPEGECLARVGDPAGGPSFAAYRVWITGAALADWASQPFRSNDPFPVTFVYNGVRPVYAAGAYYGGNKDSHSHPLSGLVSYDLALPSGDEILGSDKLTFDYPVRDATNQREQLMHWFADRLRLPTLHRRDIYLYLNGVRRGTIFHDAEQPDGVVANSHFPGDRGELFKTSNDNETTDAGVRIQPFVRNLLDVFETDGAIRAARYRWTTGARARGSRTRLDDTSIIDLMRRADDTGPDYERRLLEIIDMENWMRTFALIDLASFWDAFGNPNWKNTYLYKPDRGKWVQFTWDFDVGLGVFNDPPTQQLFPTGFDPNVERMYQTPGFVRAYWRAMEEALGTFFSGAGVTPVLEPKRAAYDAAGLGFTSPFSPSGPYNLSVTNWIDQRAAFIRPQLNAVNAAFDVQAPADGSSTAQPTITLSGTAPVGAVVLEANGIPLAVTWMSVSRWSAPFVLRPGANPLTVRALGAGGTEIGTESLTVSYTGTAAWPALAINEWMASNQTTLPDPADGRFDDWIELFNLEGVSVDLAGWFLSDDPADPFKFRIPPGFGIPAGGFLLVWADNEPAQNAPSIRPDLHVAFALSVSGESILLTAPDGTLVDRVDFGRQSTDRTEGRREGGTVALAIPSPGSANGRAAVSPRTTVTSDGGTLTFTVVAEPGFAYVAEASDNLIAWQPFGTVVATGGTVTFSAPLVGAHRYYRFRRTP